MRIIKLSKKDPDFPDRSSVDDYFQNKLPNRNPPGKFLLTKGRITETGISKGELLVFSYETEITYVAKAASYRLPNSNYDNKKYPFYFIVDIESISKAKGDLVDIEAALPKKVKKNIVHTQGWPRIPDSPEIYDIWNKLKEYPLIAEHDQERNNLKHDIDSLLVQSSNICGGKLRIEGTRITVNQIVVCYKQGYNPEEITELYPHLTLAQVYTALAYYHGNRDLVESSLESEKEEAEMLERQYMQSGDRRHANLPVY